VTDYNALPEQRQSIIYQMLKETGRVIGVDMARQLAVSEHTIRRDLQVLARQGLCKKVYGGAVSGLVQSASFAVRQEQNVAEKAQIARRCAQMIRSDSCIFIDAGSTNLAIVDFIPPAMALTVVTNSPPIAVALSHRQNGEVILLGGKVNPQTGSTLGSETVNQMRNMLFDQAFIGVCGLDPQAGLTAVYYEDACFKREVIAQSSEVIAAVTAEKIPQVARYKVAACEELDIVVVSKAAQTDNFRHSPLRVEIAA